MRTFRSYTELREIQGFRERFQYLKLSGSVGTATFGFDRYLNQKFYTSKEWRQIRHHVIVRDQGCDLGVLGYEILSKIIIHHMNPITVNEIVHGDDSILDPEYLITVTHQTHNAIHYGDEKQLPRLLIDRKPGDTKLW